MKRKYIVTFCAIAGPLALLSTGCTETEGYHSNVSLIAPGLAVIPPAQSNNDDGFYHPPRNPQFNTARDQ
jgi:hypothetical protein